MVKEKTKYMSTPFKMKGSPMQRNFGIGSPLQQTEKSKSKSLVWEILKRKSGTNKAKNKKPLVTADNLKEQDARIKAKKNIKNK